MDRKPRKTIWVVREGHTWISSGEIEEYALIKAAPFVRRYVLPPLAEQVELAPDDRMVICPPWSGGTWGGGCGSQLWIDDPEYHIDFVQERVYDNVRTTQMWHHHRFEGNPWQQRYDAKDLLGFRVECEGRHRHDGPHRAGPFVWETKLTPIQEENLFRRNGQRQERLELV